MSDSLFQFEALAQYPIPPFGMGVFSIALVVPLASLLILTDGIPLVTYPLIDAQAQPQSVAIHLLQADSQDHLAVGTVTFARQDCLQDSFVLDDDQTQVRLQISDDVPPRLGILEVCDLQLGRKHIYFFDMMPLLLRLDGNRLLVKTLRHEDSDEFGPWYLIF